MGFNCRGYRRGNKYPQHTKEIARASLGNISGFINIQAGCGLNSPDAQSLRNQARAKYASLQNEEIIRTSKLEREKNQQFFNEQVETLKNTLREEFEREADARNKRNSKSVFFTPTKTEKKVETSISKRREETEKVGNRYTQNVKNIVAENSKPVSRRNKPDRVFNQNEITQNQTSIADVSKDVETFLNEQSFDVDVISNILNNEDKETKEVSFNLSTENFVVVDNRIKGIVKIESTQKSNEDYILHLQFSPLDLKQNVFNEKKNILHFKSDLTESIQINETANNFKNVSIEIHIMKNNKVIQKSFIEVNETDSLDSPKSDSNKSDYTKYAIAGIGLIGLIFLFKKIRGKNV
jgi:hypothetical protein